VCNLLLPGQRLTLFSESQYRLAQQQQQRREELESRLRRQLLLSHRLESDAAQCVAKQNAAETALLEATRRMTEHSSRALEAEKRTAAAIAEAETLERWLGEAREEISVLKSAATASRQERTSSGSSLLSSTSSLSSPSRSLEALKQQLDEARASDAFAQKEVATLRRRVKELQEANEEYILYPLVPFECLGADTFGVAHSGPRQQLHSPLILLTTHLGSCPLLKAAMRGLWRRLPWILRA